MHHHDRERTQVFNHIVPVRYAVHGIVAGAVKAKKPGRVFPVKGIGGAGQRSASERADVHALPYGKQALPVPAEHLKISAEVMGQCDRLCFLQMSKARHAGGNVVLHDPADDFKKRADELRAAVKR